jgi:hypothetical protein
MMHDLDDDALRAFLTRAIEKTPQDARNRFARRAETMGAGSIAIIIAKEMRRAGMVVQVEVVDADSAREAAQIAYNRTVQK